MKNKDAIIIILLVVILVTTVGVIFYMYFEGTKSTVVRDEQNKEITALKSQLKEKEEKILQLSNDTENNKEEIDLKLKEKDEKIKELEKTNNEQKENITKLNKEISSIKEGIKKRVKIKGNDWRTAAGKNTIVGSFKFDNLENVEKIGISFRVGYLKTEVVDTNSGSTDIYLSLNRIQQTATTTVRFVNDREGSTHADLEVYYKDGRTETITVHVAMG